MRGFGPLFQSSLREFFRDRTSLGFTVILPLMLVVFFGFAYRSGSSRMAVGIVDDGRSSPTTTLRRAAAELPGAQVEYGLRAHELGRLKDGTLDAVVLFRARGDGLAPRPTVYFASGNGAIALGARTLATRLALSSDARSTRAVDARVRPVITASGNRLDFVIPGILATSIMWLGIFAAIPLVYQREQQVLRRLAVTPLPTRLLVTAQILSRLLVSLIQAAFVLGAARLFFGVPIGLHGSMSGAPDVLVIVALVLLGSVSFVSIGYAIAALSPTQSSAHAWAQLISMPMLFLAGVFFPIGAMPAVLRPLIALLPLTYLADALRQVSVPSAAFVPLSADLLALAVWVVVPITIAVRFFRWT